MNSAESLKVAELISAQLFAAQSAGTLQINEKTRVSVTEPNGEFILTSSGNAVDLADYGYNYVADVAGGNAVTVDAGTSMIVGTSGDTIFGYGNNTIAAGGGNNAIVVGSVKGAGNLVATGTGNDTISATGSSTIYASQGKNVIFSNNSTGNLSEIQSSGQDTIVATGSGNQVESVSGNNALVVADQSAGGACSVDATGTGVGILGAGAGSLSVTLSGANDTLSAGNSGPTTVVASSSTVVFGGPGSLQFIGEATGTPTIVGYAGSRESLQIGASGAVFSDNGADANVTIGAGQATIYGGAGGVVNVFGSQHGALFVASGGNETIDAAQSTVTGATGNQFWGGTSSTSNDVMIGGAGTDTLAAGAGHDTMTGGGGSNAFVFFEHLTLGTNVTTITDFTSSDSVFLLDYGRTASQVLATATTGSSGLTITLADNSKVTFAGLTQASDLDGHILAGS